MELRFSPMDRLASRRLARPMTNTGTLVLVLGGTGTTGRRITSRLRERGVLVRIGSRTGEPPFDWHNRSTWPAVLDGATAVYLCYSPDLAVPGAAQTVADLAREAAGAGARRLVLLSGRGEPRAQLAEDLVREVAEAAGVSWTVVRSSWFAQNFSETFLADAVRSGDVALPVGDVREPFVDVDDIADVATAALLDDGHAGELYEVTGPRLLTFREATEEITRAGGRDVAFRTARADEFAADLAAEGVPPELVEQLVVLFAEVLDGRNQGLADGVHRALGRPPRDFADVVRDAASSGAWAFDGATR
jgi:uncharacterized protein YbjT (DUF2867 family)